MTNPIWFTEWKKTEKVTHKLVLVTGESKVTPTTQIDGIPWWPQGIDRPTCLHEHKMTFVAQINFADLPDKSLNWAGLLSFHYCDECSLAGNMAFGWNDDENPSYNVRVFPNLSLKSDELENVANTTVTGRQTSLVPIAEVQEMGDLPYEISILVPDAFFEFVPPDEDHASIIPGDTIWPSLKHVHSAKIGGHPTWVQNPEWAPFSDGGKMEFVAQLDSVIGEELTWPGGMVYLFAQLRQDNSFECEMLLQTT